MYNLLTLTYNRMLTDICYWQARTLPDAVAVIFNLTVSLFIGGFMYRYYSKSTQSIRKILKNPYMGILFWMMGKHIFSIVVFFTKINIQGKNQNVENTFPVEYVRAFMVLDTIPSIAVQTFFLIIPYNMWLGVLKVLSRNRVQRSLIEQEFVILFLYYLIIRLVILVIPLIAVCVVKEEILEQTNITQLWFQLVDSLISSLILMFSIKFFRSRFNELKIESSQKKKLILQYTLMVVINILRLVLNCIFLVLPNFSNKDECFGPNNPWFTLVYLMFATAVTHFLPIAMIIKIYHPQKNEEEMDYQAVND